jgi:hypothetical protein
MTQQRGFETDVMIAQSSLAGNKIHDRGGTDTELSVKSAGFAF